MGKGSVYNHTDSLFSTFELFSVNFCKVKVFFGRQASTRFICSLLSLPVPPGNPHGTKEDATTISGRSVPEYLEQGRVQKLLLYGLEGCGTSTIFKQVKF